MSEPLAPIRAFLWGGGALAVRCAEILVEHGDALAGILSGDPGLTDFARRLGVAACDPRVEDPVAFLSGEPFDVLFSVGNTALVPDEALARPLRLAVNFHDGPLPRYAGFHVTSWAILNHETRHGVTWHAMTSRADAGAILVQRLVDVDPRETAFTLSVKCHEAGLESFRTLLDGLAHDTLVPVAQDLEGRTSFPRRRGPPGGGIVTWLGSARDVDSFVRALDFGPAENTFGVARLWTGAEWVILDEVAALPDNPDVEPGTILRVDPDGIAVAAAAGTVLLRRLRAPSGASIPLSEFASRNGLAPGACLPELDGAARRAAESIFSPGAADDAFWIEAIAARHPAPGLLRRTAALSHDGRSACPVAVPMDLPAALRRIDTDASTADLLVSAFALFVARFTGTWSFELDVFGPSPAWPEPLPALAAAAVPTRVELTPDGTAADAFLALASERKKRRARGVPLADLPARHPLARERGAAPPSPETAVCVGAVPVAPPAGVRLALAVDTDGEARLLFDPDAKDEAEGIARSFAALLAALPSRLDAPAGTLPILDENQRRDALARGVGPSVPLPSEKNVAGAFVRQVTRTPDAVAAVCDDESITYRELDERAAGIAAELRFLGVGPETLVAICVEPSLDMLAGLLGILEAGGAYVPLDPAFPESRLDFMLRDSEARVLVTHRSLADRFPGFAGRVLRVDKTPSTGERRTPSPAAPHDTCYVLYTSGSTGQPKGVVVEHRNVLNFFAAMDRLLGDDPPGTWLSVTSISFDISVLEIFWTLCRGYRVVVSAPPSPDAARNAPAPARPIGFSLFYFASDDAASGDDKYRLLTEGARFADSHGFEAVWMPERHFHAFGGLYPNPSVLAAAVASITKRVRLRAGSVVLPLHSPIRVAEEWSIVDNLSGGRVGLSFATGWQSDDFVLAPDRYADRRTTLLRDVETVRRLWRGEALPFSGVEGRTVTLSVRPRPVQPELPVWLTAASSIDTFRQAGAHGFNVLTHLLGQGVTDLDAKIAAYRATWREAGHAGDGHVTLMLHAFVGENAAAVRERVRGPFCDYLRTSVDLIKNSPWAYAPFSRASRERAENLHQTLGPGDLAGEDMAALLENAFNRYFETSGLFGSVDDALAMVRRLRTSGVDEIACLVDFGVDVDSVLTGLEFLDAVRVRSASGPADAAGPATVAALIRRHGVTHMQCTPSLAALLLADRDSAAAFRGLRRLLVGGEALPASLANRLLGLVHGTLHNMYGPTETTVWSATHTVAPGEDPVPIGKPLANTQIHVLDERLEPVPAGAAGEIYIGGDGVARGYWRRPELTAARFLRDPFSAAPGARLYRTGDVGRLLHDGRLEFLGRSDQQVKVRGHRIELGEIEAALEEHPAARQAVVVVHGEGPAEARLVAYFLAPRRPEASDLAPDQARRWRDVWEETYRRGNPADPAFDTTGWVRSDTGLPFGAQEMTEWVEATVARILALGPRRVLEVGCGTGLLLHRIAPRVDRYVGLDPSRAALERVRRVLAAAPDVAARVELREASAEVLDELEGPFDVVCLNSVVQYFANACQLERVLDRAVRLVAPGGAVFVGDVRSFALLETFHCFVERARAAPDEPDARLRERARAAAASERELVLDPSFFCALAARTPAISSVVARPKRGRADNEVTRFRYDVVLHVGGERPAAAGHAWVDGRGMTLAALRQRLAEAPRALALSSVPNGRLDPTGIHPEDLQDLGDEHGYAVELFWTGDREGSLDVAFVRQEPGGAAAPFPAARVRSAHPSAAPANDPAAPEADARLAASLREHLRTRLPDAMVPAVFMRLDRFPLTPNGKIDRKALPAPMEMRAVAAAPADLTASPLEQRLARIWADVIGLDRVSLEDSFFDLGGHSLSAIQVAHRVRREFHVDLPLHVFLQRPTVRRLAEWLATQERAGAEAGSGAHVSEILRHDSAGRDEPFPLTDLQEAYLAGRSDELAGRGLSTHLYFEIDTPALDLERLTNSWNVLVARHAMLRAVVSEDGAQRILPDVPAYAPPVDDLRALDPEAAAARISSTRERMAHEGLAAGRWPLFEIRVSLLPGSARIHLNFDGLIVDGWSLFFLFREWSGLYVGRLRDLPPLEITFRDYVLAERRRRGSEEFRLAREYWLARLEDLPPAPTLPVASPAPAVLRFARRSARLEAAVWAPLRARAARADLAPPALLLAAYAEVLSMWSGTPRFTVNVPRFNREPVHPQVNDLVGEFASFTLLAVERPPEATFEEVARRLQKQLWADLEHGRFGGVDVLRELARRRGSVASAAMPIVFTSLPQDPRDREASLASATRGLGNVGFALSETSQVWLDAHLYEENDALVCDWDVLDGVFEPGVPEAMFEAYVRFLRRLASDETLWSARGADVARLLLPDDQRKRRALVNATDSPLTEDLVHDLFTREAEERPDAVAVVSGDIELTYGELSDLSGALARQLRILGAGPNRLVAVAMEKGWEQVVAVLGILRAGAAYVPVDPALPAERRRLLLSESAAKVVLTQGAIAGTLDAPQDLAVLPVGRERAGGGNELPAGAPATPDDLAYVLYTSGSTGSPKGVMVAHRGIVNAIRATNDTFRVGSADRVFGVTALHHDMSVFDIFGTLAAGGTLVLPDAAGARDPAHWADRLRRERVTIWNSVPAMLEMLVEREGGRSGPPLADLRLAFVGGDWIPVTLPGRLRAIAPGVRFVSVGGPTETTLWNIWHPVTPADAARRSVPYGRPIANTRYFVLGEALEDLPEGTGGEMFVAGVGVAKGYWRDDAGTQEKFVRHPRTGERLYRTGDLGRYLPDGEIEFLGRRDFQVKIDGQRIELGEIEAALLQHPSVRSAVAGVQSLGNRKRLVAWVVPQAGAAVDVGALRAHLEARLPSHMLPAAWVPLERLPLSPNGKLNRVLLPEPGEAEPGRAGGPEGEVVRRVAAVIGRILGVESVAADTNLIQNGATSLDMIRIGNALEREFGHRPRMDELFRLATPRALAARYESATASRPGTGLAGRDSALLLSEFSLLHNPEARERFRDSEPGLRRDCDSRPATVLAEPEPRADLETEFRARRSHRRFSLRPVPAAAFGGLLGCLRRLAIDGRPKYRYASPGGLYACQLYAHVKPGRVAGIGPGTYYYDPAAHRLVSLAPDAVLDRSIHVPFVNTPIFDEAGFSLFLVAELAAIAPSYGDRSMEFVMLEAGGMAHLLEETAPAFGIGLCQIGGVDFDRIRDVLALGRTHVGIHSLLGGCALGENDVSRAADSSSRAEDLAARIRGLSAEEVRALLEANRRAAPKDPA